MYCVYCGVKLADSEQKCPLCGTEVYHPALERKAGASPFPCAAPREETVTRGGAVLVLTLLTLVPLTVTLICNYVISGAVTWAGYVVGALLLFYVSAVLPLWFRHPNPVVFVPCSFLAAGLYLLYIDLVTRGGWFLSFAFPVTGCMALGATAVVALCRYLRRGYLFIFGGAMIYNGLFMLLLEFLLNLTFGVNSRLVWSFYPMAALVLFGTLLLLTGICRPLRQALHRKFFI